MLPVCESVSEVPSGDSLVRRGIFRRVNSLLSFASSQEVLDGLTLREKLISGQLDGSLRDLVVEVQASDGSVLTVGSGAWEGEHDALRDVVEGAVSLEAD